MVRSGVLFQLTLLCILPSSKEPTTEPMERTTATRDLFDCLVRINVLSKGNKPVVYTHVHHLSIHSTVKCLFSERQVVYMYITSRLTPLLSVPSLKGNKPVVYMYITSRFTPLLSVSSLKGNKPVVYMYITSRFTPLLSVSSLKGNKPVVYMYITSRLTPLLSVPSLKGNKPVVYMYITSRFTPLLSVSSLKGSKPVVVSHAWPISIKCTRGLFRYCLHEYNLTIICKSLN